MRRILDNDFFQPFKIPQFSAVIRNTNASKGRGANPEAMKAFILAQYQALKHRAIGEQSVERALRDVDALDRELLEVGEVEPIHVIRGEFDVLAAAKVALAGAESEDAEGGCQPERGRWRWGRMREPVPQLELLQIVKRGGPEPGV